MKRNILLSLLLTLAILVFSQAAFAAPVPDTGQTLCYDAAGKEIACPSPGQPFYGQDANYTINPMSYTKLDSNGNALPDSASSWAMVKDNVTGLIWENKTDDGSIHDKDNTYTYSTTTDLHSGTAGFIYSLNFNKFGGFSDWRIPTLEELGSIANYNIQHVGPAINTMYFQNIASGLYWSSNPAGEVVSGGCSINKDTYPCFSYDIGCMSFDNGSFSKLISGGLGECCSYIKGDRGYVRAVRSGK